MSDIGPVQFGIRLKDAKSTFFDRPAVKDMMDKKSLGVLSKFGSFVRRSAKGLVRPRKRASRPGEAPSSHTGLLRDFIFFSYDRQSNSVVIGPVKLGGRKGKDIPMLLEYGGLATLTSGPEMGKKYKLSPRPYMGPALDANEDKLPGLWAGVI